MIIKDNEPLNSMIEKIQVAIIVHGTDTKIKNYNRRALELLDLTEDQIMGKASVDPDWRFFAEDGSTLEQENYPVDQVLATRAEVKNMIGGIYRPVKKDVIYVLINAVPDFDDAGELSDVIVTFVDITEQRRLEKALQDSEKNMASVLNNSQDGIVRIDKNFRHIFVNRALLEAVGLPAEQYLGKTNTEIGFPEELCTSWQEIHESVFQSGKSVTSEFSFQTVNKGERYFQAVTSPECSEAGAVETIITIIRDITALKQAEADKNAVIEKLEKAYVRIESMAYTDFLTGLLNRRMMLRQIEYEFSRAKREGNTFALLLFDIDFFKAINDSCGHECGDYVIKQIAGIMNETFRHEDKLCRWGGDEFLCMAVNVDKQGAVASAEKLRSAVETHEYVFKKQRLSLTITIGIEISRPDVPIDFQLEQADKNLYKGKQKGRNQIVA